MAENTTNQIATIKQDVSSQVLAKIHSFQESGEITIPKDYSVENALKSAYIVLSDPKNNILTKCSKSSIAEALLKMVVHGVSPVKKQCYFIPYGDKLECSISYAGNIAIAKRYGNLKEIKGQAIFKGDEFTFEVDPTTGRKKVLKHSQTLESLGSNEVIGAYAVMQFADGTIDTEIMNIKQIEASWKQGGSKGASPAHKNFADQMAIKTVINRACKLVINSSDDNVLYDPLNEEEKLNKVEADVDYEIQENANKTPLDYEDVEVEEEVKEEVKEVQTEIFPEEAPFQ